jgi:hypothetical protein
MFIFSGRAQINLLTGVLKKPFDGIPDAFIKRARLVSQFAGCFFMADD